MKTNGQETLPSPTGAMENLETVATADAVAVKVNVPVNIITLAPELILRVFNILEIGEATCFGLTCRRFYNVLKNQYPEPISLKFTMNIRAPECYCWKRILFHPANECCCVTDLYRIIAHWIGPRYRMGYRTATKWIYYNREVYGEYHGPRYQEKRSVHRHKDYQVAQYLYHDSFRPNRLSPNPLPNPFNKGDDWYEETITAIKASISHFEFMKDWKEYWSQLMVFHDNRECFNRFEDEYLWQKWSDGLKLMEL